MIPIGDVIPSRTRPVVTAALILAMSIAFFAGRLSGRPIDDAGELAGWLTVFLSLFLHDGWIHLVTNLAALWIFGRSVEDRFGHGRFLFFFVLAGTLAAAAASTRGPIGGALNLGASGAVAGIMGAHLVLFPRARVLLVMFVLALDVIEVPALIVMGLWFLIQLADAATSASSADLALLARLAGLGTGLALVWVFRRREREKVGWWND